MPLLVLPLRIPAGLIAACLLAVAHTASAQLGLSHVDDAAPIPKGMLRVNVATGWGRYDERFTAAGKRTLGDELSSDSLGSRQFPALIPVEAGLRTLTNNAATRLSLGRLATISDVRTVTTPISLEYGLTKRFSIGILIPFVQTRRSNFLAVNADSSANVGFVPTRSRAAAATANQLVYSSLKGAADSLTTLLNKCPANATAIGCAAINANPTDAASARTQAQQFADAVRSALGTDTATTRIAPRVGGALAASIDTRRAAINGRLQQYLGAGAGATSGVFTAEPFTYIDLQGTNKADGLLRSSIGGGLDSIYTIDRARITAASLGAQYLLFDRFQHDTLPPRGVQSRMMLAGSYRFLTPNVDTAHTTLGISSNDGPGLEMHSALDVISGSLGATIAARFVKPMASEVVSPLIGDPEAAFPAPTFGTTMRTVGTTVGLDITPRYLIGDWFALDAHYGFERTGATSYAFAIPTTICTGCETLGAFVPTTRTAQRLGLGFRYSTVESTTRGTTGYPIEVSFTHLQTISGTAGVPNLRRDQIQVRLFFRIQD